MQNKRCFATELRARIIQREGEKRKNDPVGEETSGERGLKLKEKTAVEASASTEVKPRSRHAEPSSSVLGKKIRKETQSAALKARKCVAPGSQEAYGDNGGDVCEAATADGGRESRDEGWRGEMADTRGSQTPPHSDDERLCISETGTKRKRRKKKGQAHASVERQGQEQPEDPGVPEPETLEAEPRAADDAEYMEMSLCEDQRDRQEERSARKKRRKEKKNKTGKIATEECLESESVMSQDGNKKNDDVSRAEESSVGTVSGGERVKVKRKKNKRIGAAGEREEPHGTTGQPGVSGKTVATEDESCHPENEKRVKKKHRSTPGETGEVTDEHRSDTSATLKGKSRKKKKEKPAWDGEEADPAKKKRRQVTTDTSEGGLERSREDADAVEKDVQTPVLVPDEGSDTQSAEIAGSSERSVRRVKKKKRKKKRDCEDAADGGAEGSEDGQGAMGGSRFAPEVWPPGRAFDVKAEASPSGCSVRKKHGKSKRVLYNPAGDLLE